MKNRFYKVTNSSPKLGEVPQAEESVMTIATSALTDSLGASATPPNLGGESRYSIRKVSVLCTLCSVLCMLMSCSEEQDLLVPEQTNALHITSVTIDGQQVARTRVVADDGTYDYSMSNQPYNQSYNGFTAGDALQLVTNGLSAEGVTTNQFYAIYNADGTWTIADPQDDTNPVSLKPTDTWADASIEAAAFGGGELSGTSDNYPSKSQGMGIVQGDIDVSNSLILGDRLVADKSNGSITIDTDVKSPTLGAVTIKLKHAHALLRLPQSADDIEEGTYIVDGTAHNVTGLGTLWAVLNMSSTSTTIYCPLTKVTIGEADYLQAIVPADNEGDYTLTGFKAVMLTEESGASGEETTQNSQLTTQNSLTLDLPFKVGTETTASTGIALQPNYRYPLTLNIAPHTASVTLSSPQGKPGWGTDEEELSNLLNEPITVDGTQYIKLDGTATDVEKVKSIIEAATAVGYTNFYVTGKTLAAYSNGTAKTVVGEAIRLAEGTTVSLLLPSATSIGDFAFSNCAALESVSAPKALTIGDHAFDYCTSLTSMSLPSATSIGVFAFFNCAALKSVSLPAAETIGKDAFYACAALKSVSLPAATSIGDAAFGRCDALESVSAPKALTIGDSAFDYCSALASVSLPDVTEIGEFAFVGCTSLTSVSLPSATSIGIHAFRNCTALTSVSLPAATKIGDAAFLDCSALISVTFGSVIETVGQDAFLYVTTETCALTLNSGQQSSTVPVSTDEDGNPTWAGYTWASISYVDNEGNAVESN